MSLVEGYKVMGLGLCLKRYCLAAHLNIAGSKLIKQAAKIVEYLSIQVITVLSGLYRSSAR